MESKIAAEQAKLPKSKRFRPSIAMIIWVTVLWVMIWGDLSWGNVLNGILLGLILGWIAPMPNAGNEKFVVRPIATIRLFAVFLKDIAVASVQIAWFIITGRQPKEAIIRVQTRAESDIFLVITSAFTALVPGSIVVDAHRLTGMMYVHIFDVSGEDGMQKAHDTVIKQEERILRAFGTKKALIEAGYVPGGSMKLGRLPKSEFDDDKKQPKADQETQPKAEG